MLIFILRRRENPLFCKLQVHSGENSRAVLSKEDEEKRIERRIAARPNPVEGSPDGKEKRRPIGVLAARGRRDVGGRTA